MRILVTERIADAGIEIMREAGHQVDVRLDLTPEELLAEIGGYHALVVRSATQVTRQVIEAGASLKVIGRAGVGVDNVDVEAATERGVIVCNAPTSNVVSAAEQTMALLLASARRTPQANASMKQGLWERGKFSGNELYQKTLAIFGIGRIGGLVAARARAFEMTCIGYDPYATQERADDIGVTLYDSIEEVLPLADFITVHMPSTKETLGMFGAREFALMKDGVYLVNAARGGIYDEQALTAAVKSGKVAGAGIDVYEVEPCTDSPLHGLEEVILTPHLGASTEEAQIRAGLQIAEFVNLGLAGSMVPTAVNMQLVPEDVRAAIQHYVKPTQDAGQFLAQMAGKIESLTVRAYGDLARSDVSLLALAALCGIYGGKMADPVNYVNVKDLADADGITVKVDNNNQRTEYVSQLSLEARSGNQTYEVSITTFGNDDAMRIVSVMGYRLDFVPGKHTLIFSYDDRPGQLAIISRMLGDANINISSMVVGKCATMKQDLVMLGVDDPVSEDLKTAIDGAVGSLMGWSISL